MTSDATSGERATRPGAPRNPRPRPALRFEGEEHWVVAARPLPGNLGRGEEEKGSERRKGKAEKSDKTAKRVKTGKDRHRRKAEKKKSKDTPLDEAARRTADERNVTVTLPPEFRRALERAAGEHGLTPQGLAAFVLVEWLDR